MFYNSKIRALRQNRNWSLADIVFELAKLSHRYTRQTILNWETGSTEPKASNVAHLAEVFGVPVQSFFEQKDSK